MSRYIDRKEKRKQNYLNNIKGWKERSCISCNGSGYYDHNNRPNCGACNGTGKEKYKPK
jgi:DnaJ-class molecular chaperone